MPDSLSTFIKKYWRIELIAIVFGLSFCSFLLTSMPDEKGTIRVLNAIYYSASLFILGALDIGFPRSGPQFAMIMLWLCYFLAPLLTLSFVVSYIENRLLNHLPGYLKDHVLILGMGKNGFFLYELLRKNKHNEKIIIIDRNPDNQYAGSCSKNYKVWWLKNDFNTEVALKRANIKRARVVYITTNEDLVNLNAMSNCIRLNPFISRVYCHLQNYSMHDGFKNSLAHFPEYRNVRIFNSYRSAAIKFIEEFTARKEFRDAPARIIIFLGFGHFGQTLFDDMISNPLINQDDEIIIATLKTKLIFDIKKYEWARQKGEIRCLVHPPLYKDIFTAELWNELKIITENKNKLLTLINCLDNDIANINLAIQMKSYGPDILKNALFYCRIFKPVSGELEKIMESGITESKNKDIILFPVENALHEAFKELTKETSQ